MSPALRHPRPGCALTDSPDWGGASGAGGLYPAGRICAAEGCGTVLRRSNPGPLCGPCKLKAKEVQVATPQKRGDTRAKILALCRERGRLTARQAADALAIAIPSARYHIDSLEADGLIEQAGDPAGRAIEWRPLTAPMVTTVVPEATAPASPACDTDTSEGAESQSEGAGCDTAAASALPPAGPPPFAGMMPPPPRLCTDDEMTTLVNHVLDMERLPRDAQIRVASYIGARYL